MQYSSLRAATYDTIRRQKSILNGVLTREKTILKCTMFVYLAIFHKPENAKDAGTISERITEPPAMLLYKNYCPVIDWNSPLYSYSPEYSYTKNVP